MIETGRLSAVAVLWNSKYEHFARLVAMGQSPAQAYIAVGYEEKTAYTCGPRLLKRPEVQARVTELQQKAAQTSIQQAGLSREFVLRELMDNALQAKQNQEWSASNRALELLGKELGLFVDRSDHGFHWDGDPNTLTEEQHEKLVNHLIRLAVGDDPQAIAEARKQLEAEASTPGTSRRKELCPIAMDN